MRRWALAVALLGATAAGASPLPAPRPAPAAVVVMAGLIAPVAAARPTRDATTVAARAPEATAPAPARAAGLCGDPRLKGRRLTRIGTGGGCGIAEPISLTAVGTVRLEPAATVNCDTARALADWVETAVAPAAVGHLGSGVVALDVAASYACRRINNRPSGKLSEHAKGNAIDIAAFKLANGQRVTLLEGWRGEGSAFMRAAWQGACGPFGTVLGPEADRYHQDHFHFDVAQRRSGPVCR